VFLQFEKASLCTRIIKGPHFPGLPLIPAGQSTYCFCQKDPARFLFQAHPSDLNHREISRSATIKNPAPHPLQLSRIIRMDQFRRMILHAPRYCVRDIPAEYLGLTANRIFLPVQRAFWRYPEPECLSFLPPQETELRGLALGSSFFICWLSALHQAVDLVVTVTKTFRQIESGPEKARQRLPRRLH